MLICAVTAEGNIGANNSLRKFLFFSNDSNIKFNIYSQVDLAEG